MRVLDSVLDRPAGAWAFEDDLRIARKARLLLPLGATFRPLIFFSLRPDGSIVCGPAFRRDRVLRTARRRASSDPLPPKLQAALGETPMPKDFHITFHQSGVVNALGDVRTYRAPFSMPSPHQLGLFRFEDPRQLPPEKDPGRRDIVLPGQYRTESALEGKLTLVPEGTVVFYSDVSEQFAFVFNALHKDGTVQYRLQFSILATDKPWPTETTIVWVSQDPHSSASAGR